MECNTLKTLFKVVFEDEVIETIRKAQIRAGLNKNFRFHSNIFHVYQVDLSLENDQHRAEMEELEIINQHDINQYGFHRYLINYHGCRCPPKIDNNIHHCLIHN